MIYKKVYTLHEYGAPSHFYGLEYLVNEKGYEIHHREFNYIHQLGSSIKKIDLNKFRKLVINIFFIFSLIFTKNKIIVIGIAPYNFRLFFLRILLKNHKVSYFTSYTFWDQSRMAHSLFYSSKLLNIWKLFLSKEVEHIFAVSKKTSDQLVKNGFSTPENITVVNHSYNEIIEARKYNDHNFKFIYAGRLTESKGIFELIEIFKELPQCEFTIVGNGELKDSIIDICKSYKNIKYLGYIKGLKNLIPIYKSHSFLLLNSKRTESWEELFGITIIEGMACGLIPITTDHSGPNEIITNEVNGFICEEGQIKNGILHVLNLATYEVMIIKKNVIKKSGEYHSSAISKKWNSIFK